MKKFLNKVVFLHNLPGIQSCVFENLTSTDFIGAYSIPNHIDLDDNSSETEIIDEISSFIDCNPDGYFAFIPQAYEDAIKQLIHDKILEGIESDEINFSNGEIGESVLFHKVDKGTILEVIDPECFSEFLEDLFVEIENHVPDLLSFSLCHISSKIHYLADFDRGEEFLEILQRNNINIKD